jgi:hypothetical protein
LATAPAAGVPAISFFAKAGAVNMLAAISAIAIFFNMALPFLTCRLVHDQSPAPIGASDLPTRMRGGG